MSIPSDLLTKVENNEAQIGLKWRSASGSSPSINVYRVSYEIDEPKDYIWNVNKATSQTPSNYHTSIASVSGGSSVWLPANTFQKLNGGQHPYLLFEGAARGTGQLCLVLKMGSGSSEVEWPGVWLKLVDVKKMFDKRKGSPDSYPNPPGFTDREPPRPGVGVDPEDMGEPFEAEPDEKNEAIILVHGWNMTDGDWRVFSSSFFKRLWWKGYKGRFYTFGWPTYNSDHDTLGFLPTHYNKSEYVAWKYGPALKAFVDGIPKGTKNVAAHSMGNVVMASAMKSGLTVNSYVAMQAALPAGCYDESDDVNDYADFVDANTTDPTPDRANPDLGYRGLMAGAPTGNFHNFFSAEDYALKTGTIIGVSVSWEGNQISYKPNGWVGLRYDYDPLAYLIAERPRLLLQIPNGDISSYWLTRRFVPDHHEIMSFIARPLSEALGARKGPTAGFNEFNLADQSLPYSFGNVRTEHSGQFQRPIQKTEFFYHNMLQKMGIQFNYDK